MKTTTTTTTAARKNSGVSLLARALMLAIAASGAALGCVVPADDGELGEELALGEAQGALSPEVCNGLDDDGNNRIDEGNVCGCTEYVHADHEYMFCNTMLDWSTARKAAIARGFDLVAIDNQAENDFLGPKVPNIGNGSWIGFTDSAQEGTWTWISGNAVGYTHWAPNEPNNGNNEDCGTMWPGNATPGSTGWWNDLNCAWTNQTSIYELFNPVTWTGLNGAPPTGLTINGTRLTRTAATGDIGARSTQTITAADQFGFVQFTTSETDKDKRAGLGNIDNDNWWVNIEYGIELKDGLVLLRQGVNNITVGAYNAGDVFRVEALPGKVQYVWNGAVFHMVSSALPYPLVLDTSLYDVGATIGNARLKACPSGDCVTQGFWTNVYAVLAAGDSLTKLGPSGGGTSGASSQTTLAGDCYVEFQTNENNKLKIAGLGVNGDLNAGSDDVEYSFRLDAQGNVTCVRPFGSQPCGTYVPGDMFRIEVQGSQVRYLKNGGQVNAVAVVMRPEHLDDPRMLDTSLTDTGATITNATIGAL